MWYYLNDSVGKKKLHTSECYLYKEHGKSGLKIKKWKEFKTLNEAQKYCKESRHIYHYCGQCMREFNKAKVK